MDLRNVSSLFVVFFSISIMACDDRPAPFSPPSDDLLPPTPEHLRASVGDGRVHLRWEIPDTSNVKSYRIYRRRSGIEHAVVVDSSEQRLYIDSDLTNGTTYVYSVSAVSLAGFEGRPSDEVEATPHIYDMIIEEGNEYTNKTIVTLRFTVPEGTALMKISNDSTFSGASWESFSRERKWTIPEGDGEKTVFAKFQDLEGNENAEIVSDRIILDTVASIESVSEDTGGQVKAPGDVIHFALVAGEPKGFATVDIQFAVNDIVLYDNGTNGDQIPDDGTYERDFTVPADVQFNNRRVIGKFRDRVGNGAPEVTAPGLITVQRPPTSVRLLAPSPIESAPNTLEISWSMNSDPDFSAYRLYRSRSEGVDLASNLIAHIPSQATTTYRDTTLQPGTTYYYRIYVFDQSGLSTPSNEAEGITAQNQPPLPVVLSQPSPVDSVTLRLSWSRNTEADFASYRLYRSVSSPVDTAFAPIAIIGGNRNQTQYDDRGVVRGVTYFYRVFVFDRFGLAAGSNEVQGAINQ